MHFSNSGTSNTGEWDSGQNTGGVNNPYRKSNETRSINATVRIYKRVS